MKKQMRNAAFNCLMRRVSLIILLFASDALAQDFLVGTCVHFEARKTDPDEFGADSQKLGINSFRAEIPWWDIEKAEGQLAFPSSLSRVDRAINDAVKTGGHPLLILGYGNQFYDQGSFPLSDTAQAAFVRYAEFVAVRYKNKVRHYELWNEWNIGLSTGHPIPFTYSGSGKDYSRLLKKVYRAIKVIDPDAIVIAGAVANRDVLWINEMIKSADAQYDGISVHPYNYSNGPEGRTPEEAVQWLNMLHKLLPPPSNIFVTEMGWPTYSGSHTTDKDTAGDYLARFYLLAREKPFIKGIWWYDFQDDGDNPADSEQNFGIVSRGYLPKPSFFAMRDIAIQVSQASVGSNVELGKNVHAVRLVGTNGKSVLAVWSLQQTGAQSILLSSTADHSEFSLLQVGANSQVNTIRLGKNLPPIRLSVTGRPWLISGDLYSMIIN
jgi:hypothetical protein